MFRRCFPATLILFALPACAPDSPGGPDRVHDQPLEAPPGVFGLNIDPSHGLGDPSGAFLASIGAGIVRFTFKDETWTNDPDPARLAHYQQKVAEYHAHGIRSLVLLNYETAPGFPRLSDDPVAWANYRARFAARAGAIAAELGPVHAYEIWNEPDEPNPRPEYAPNISPHLYGELLRESWSAIKAVSTAAVIIGGLDSGNPNYLVAAQPLFADGVGIHPYGQRPDPNWPSPSWGFGNLETLVRAYHQTTGMPVWITELGIEDESIQAEYLSRAFARVAGPLQNIVAHITWFCWSDGMVHGFGITDASLQPKPAFAAFVEATGGAIDPPSLPDVVVSAIHLSPAAPRPGDAVTISATIENRGGSSTEQHVGVAFFVNGGYFSWGAEGALAAGESRTGYFSVDAWTAEAGRHEITAWADDVDRFVESDENNNTRVLVVDVGTQPPPPDRPRVERACFSQFTVPGDAAPTIRADIEVDVPGGIVTQPMGTSASSCSWYGAGESFRDVFPEHFGRWRIGIDVWGASSARDRAGVDHPWRFALRSDGCDLNASNTDVPAESGRYVITGFFKLAPGDEVDPAQYYAGIVQEGVSWNDDGTRCE